jgi:hypothetical protein
MVGRRHRLPPDLPIAVIDVKQAGLSAAAKNDVNHNHGGLVWTSEGALLPPYLFFPICGNSEQSSRVRFVSRGVSAYEHAHGYQRENFSYAAHSYLR